MDPPIHEEIRSHSTLNLKPAKIICTSKEMEDLFSDHNKENPISLTIEQLRLFQQTPCLHPRYPCAWMFEKYIRGLGPRTCLMVNEAKKIHDFHLDFISPDTTVTCTFSDKLIPLQKALATPAKNCDMVDALHILSHFTNDYINRNASVDRKFRIPVLTHNFSGEYQDISLNNQEYIQSILELSEAGGYSIDLFTEEYYTVDSSSASSLINVTHQLFPEGPSTSDEDEVSEHIEMTHQLFQEEASISDEDEARGYIEMTCPSMSSPITFTPIMCTPNDFSVVVLEDDVAEQLGSWMKRMLLGSPPEK